MNDSRLTTLLSVCDEALRHDGAARTAYLDSACAGDDSLRRDVEALLSDEVASRPFMETPAVATVSQPLTIGQRLGPYEITALLGSGGMGAVYRARDTRLGRTVAIKVLVGAELMDRAARQRFLDEARAIASLNDPRICALHDVGRDGDVDFLVLEYVEGQTLGERLARGRLPLPLAIEYGVQLAEALAHAHRRGLVHRDVKPGNVMVTKSAVKLLDFGLAGFRRPAGSTGPQHPADRAGVQTARGTLLGTVPYMAPEQLQGKEVDARTDLFGLGCVLYEMLTGHRPFAGDSETSVAGAITSAEPRPLRELQPAAPPDLHDAVSRCLAKDPEDRWQNASDLAEALRWISRSSTSSAATQQPERTRRRGALAACAVAGTLLVAVSGWLLGRSQAASAVRPQHVELAVSSWNLSLASDSLAISPDGQTVVFSASRPGEPTMLYARAIGDSQPRLLQGTAGAWLPFFSPDGKEIAFAQERAIFRMRLSDGIRQKICAAAEFAGGAWGDDGRIVYAGGYLSPRLWAVSAEGGAAEPLGPPPEAVGSVWYCFPELLPSGTVLFTIRRGQHSEIAGWSESKGLHQVIADGSRARYLQNGQLAYEAGGQLRVADFDPAALTRRGESGVVVDALAVPFDSPGYAVSRTGTLVYLPRYQGLSRLVWKDRLGKTTPLRLPARRFSPFPALSHDGRRVVVQVDEGLRRDLWIGDVDGEILERLTDSGDAWLPQFWPDDKWVAYSDGKNYDIYRVRLDRPTLIEPLAVSSAGAKSMPAVSADGRSILFNFASPRPQIHIWRRDLADSPDVLRPFVVTPSASIDRGGVFSPDGRWLAYQSDASGVMEVYVRAYQEGTGSQVSVGGGAWPSWNPRSGELFYEGPTYMFSVRIAGGKRTGPPVPLFSHIVGEGWDRIHERDRRDYAVSADGERFLMAERLESAAYPSQIHVVTNWFEELKAKRRAAR